MSSLLWTLLVPAWAVDVVVPASCRADSELVAVAAKEDHDRRLIFTLESIQTFAPWVTRIFVLQNPGCEEFWRRKLREGLIPQPEKTTWLDRCSLFPRATREGGSRFHRELRRLQRLDAAFPELGLTHQGRRHMRKQWDSSPACPTRNSFAVQTVLHHIPGLSERFVYANPGDILLQPTTVKTFFYGMKPRYPPKRTREVYRNQSIAERFQAPLPRTAGAVPGVWVPLTRRVAKRLAAKFGLWTSFVRSHRWGKYSSDTDSFGTADSEQRNSDEEDLVGVWWWYLISHPHSGVPARGNLFEERYLSADPEQWPELQAKAVSARLPVLRGTPQLRRRLRHALKGFITLEISSQGSPEVVEDAAEDEVMAELGRYLR